MPNNFFSESERASLRQVTLEELGELAEQLQPLLAQSSPPPDPSSREEIQMIFHTIGGSAGLAGIKDISALGANMETLLKKSDPSSPLPTETTAQLRSALETLLDFLKKENCA